MNDIKNITLQYPLDVDGRQISTVAMRRPVVRDMMAAQRTAGANAAAAEVEVAMFVNLCELAPDAIEKMDLGDYMELQRVYEGFVFRGSTGPRRAAS